MNQWHPPGGDVYLVDVDSAAGNASQAGGECEKGDDQGVVAAYIIHGHEEGRGGQHGCRGNESRAEASVHCVKCSAATFHQEGALLHHLEKLDVLVSLLFLWELNTEKDFPSVSNVNLH